MRWLILMLLIMPMSANAAPKWVHVVGHIAIGAGAQITVSYVAGGPSKWKAGLPAAGGIAIFKEYTDWKDKRDTGPEAIRHALMIMAGAGAVAAVEAKESQWHPSTKSPKL